MERRLAGALPEPVWPAGIHLAALDPEAAHRLLRLCYAQGYGSVPDDWRDWWSATSTDAEFDSDLVLCAMDETGTPVGFVLCWTSGFIKDVAVHQDWRGRGLGTALLLQAMRHLSSRGLRKVALKVVEENAVARRLYARHGFTATDSD